MLRNKIRIGCRILASSIFGLSLAVVSLGQGNAFSFQGRLNDGTNPANGSYDLQFRLYDAIAGGAQIGALAARPNTTLINGVFSVTLDFGATAFNNPNSVFIEIAVRPNGSPNAFTILGPRQQLTVVPFAVRAATATLADNATNAQNAVLAMNATNAVNSQNAVLATNATNAVNAQTAVNAANSTNAVNATTATTANNALNLGGVTPANYARLDFANPGNLLATGLLLTNDARQPANANGLVKAMIEILDGNITRCYNGIINSSTGNCGFIVTEPLFGVTRINFGFPVSGRFVSVTCRYRNGSFDPIRPNSGANYRFTDNSNTSVEVFTFLTNNAQDTFPADFTLILY